MLNKKGKKTTIVAIVAGVVILSLVVAMYLKIITADDVWKGLPIVGTTAMLFIGFFSKDANETHTKN